MRFARLAGVLTLAALTFAANECSGVGSSSQGGGSSSPKPPGVGSIPTDGTCKVMGDLEGQFTTPLRACNRYVPEASLVG